MNNLKQQKMMASQNKTNTVKNELIKDREAKRAEQLRMNAEIRRQWLQGDQLQSGRANRS